MSKARRRESEGRSPIYHEHRPHPRRRAGGFRKVLKNVVERSLVPRERRFYELFKQQAATLVRAAGLLERALADSTNLSMLQREIKDLENQGDELTHEIVSTLQRTFVTPFGPRGHLCSRCRARRHPRLYRGGCRYGQPVRYHYHSRACT